MVRYVVLDGQDGTGKTTATRYVSEFLEAQGLQPKTFKGLGGDGSCDFQNAMRTALLHNKFPSNNLPLEEALFSIADLEGSKSAVDYLYQNPKGVVIKDRSLPSHIAYAVARGMGLEEAEKLHKSFADHEIEVAKNHGILSIILVAKDTKMLIDRIKARQAAIGQPITERLENYEMQERVRTELVRFHEENQYAPLVNSCLIEVGADDTIDIVKAQVLSILRAHL